MNHSLEIHEIEQETTSGRRDRLIQLFVPVATLTTILINGLATTLPLNGQSTGEISDRFPSLFTPAGYVFSIWGVIYLGLIGYAVYQALPAQRTNSRLHRIRLPYLVSAAANSAWIFFWHYNQFLWSLAAMATLLASLILIYRRLTSTPGATSQTERWVVDVPFSIYLGWITVATVANVAVVLLDLQWNGEPLSPALWALLMIVIAGILGVIFAQKAHDIAYVAVLIWALVGIAVKQSATPLVAWGALTIASLLALIATAIWLRNRKAHAQLPG
ncbi:MAG: tryptophan-rich sensory protein [Caldilinea sp.]|nr:tryptophan-rich sensory protein [Caldilinea sp.]MDW8442500.1 tryptophan-rich sensory protein [Caldilineaceae bacterium]